MNAIMRPENWGLHVHPNGELMIGNHGVAALGRKFGTPIHVVHEQRLFRTAQKFKETVSAAYAGKTSVHYAFKCNSVPSVVDSIRRAGLNAEVMTEYELELAIRIGFMPGQIIVNGPCKTEEFLKSCIEKDARLIVVDSIEELRSLDAIACVVGRNVDVLLRLNLDYVPRRMSRGTATASRAGCAFGLDVKGGEVMTALNYLENLPHIRFRGYHMHIGTGIQDPTDYSRALRHLASSIVQARWMGLTTSVLDVGGGFGCPTSCEFTTSEMWKYQVFDRLPAGVNYSTFPAMSDFAREIAITVRQLFEGYEMPELIFEPGRCIAGSNQFLLLTAHHVKDRARAGKWIITDGGLSTVTMPTYYEYHELFLANDVLRPRTEHVTIIGPACFAGDVVYRNKLMPVVKSGDVIAIMDSGAYFTAFESSFGFPRPAIIAINGATCRVVRSRETIDEMMERDIWD